MHWDVSILQELKESNLGWVANWNVGCFIHLNPGSAVEQNALFNVIQSLLSQLAVKQSVLSRVLNLLVLTEELGYLHVSSGDRAGLANENLVDFAHLLWGIKLLDKDAILRVHSSGGVGQRDADCEGQALGNNDDEQDNKNVSVPETLLEENLVPWHGSGNLDNEHNND